MNKKTSLILLTSLTATFVAICAAFFSITGISKLFAGAALGAMVMASSLELGKLVGISFLYQYWKDIPFLLKSYLTTAALVLMTITSVGIYGYLSAAYQATADQLAIMDRQTEVVALKRNRFQEQLDLYVAERERVAETINQLTAGLANNRIQYVDQETGQLVTSTSSATRNALQAQLNIATEERNDIGLKIEELSDSISSLDLQEIDMVANNDLAAEVGPLRFVSNLTGWEMDMVVNIFALMIVIVFDPLAVALVISVNFLLKYKEEDDDEEPVRVGWEEAAKEVSEKYKNALAELAKHDIMDEAVQSVLDHPNETIAEDEEPFQVYVTPVGEGGKGTVTTSEPPDEIKPIVEKFKEQRMTLRKEPESKSRKERYEEELTKEQEAKIIEKYLELKDGFPEFMRSDYDWNSRDWQNNPLAVMYMKYVKNPRREKFRALDK